MSKLWTKKELNFLFEYWGYKTIPQIAKSLHRSTTAVIQKAKKLKLGPCTSASEFLTANKVAQLMKIDLHAVTDSWIFKGLKYQRKAMRGERKMILIRFSDLVKWLEKNQDRWDSRRVDLYALGTEPKWLKEKRIRDSKRILTGCNRWTPVEDQIAINLFKKGYTIQEIANKVGRTHAGVEHRISRLDVWGTGKYTGGDR